MVEIEKIMGRMGNKMFIFSMAYALARENNTDWYFQDPKWFMKYQDHIKILFGSDISFLPYVSIHIRRGDYVNNSFYTDLSQTNYYTKAVKLFPDSKFLVFSDDPEFARDYFPDETRFQIMDGHNEIDDLNQMAGCEHNIIANSSYSWWAGFLNPNPLKKVIAPLETKYYSDGVVRTKYPKEFSQLDFKYVKES